MHFPKLPEPSLHKDWKSWAGQFVIALNTWLSSFFIAASGDVSLTADGVATTTVLNDELMFKGDRIFLTPQNANAAAALGTTFVPKVTVNGTVTITHAASALTRTFSYAIVRR